jgi:hypothetical protein
MVTLVFYVDLLLINLLGKDSYIYLDNWPASPRLVDTTSARRTDVVGIMKVNRN